MTVNTPSKDDGRGLRERLEDIPRGRLVEEVVSRWDDMIRLEGEIASLRRRVREAELVAKGSDSDGAVAADGDVPRWSATPVRRIWSNLWVSMADHGAFNATNWHDSLGTAHVCKSQFPHCPGTTSRRALTAVAHHGRLWSALVHWVYITAL